MPACLLKAFMEVDMDSDSGSGDRDDQSDSVVEHHPQTEKTEIKVGETNDFNEDQHDDPHELEVEYCQPSTSRTESEISLTKSNGLLLDSDRSSDSEPDSDDKTFIADDEPDNSVDFYHSMQNSNLPNPGNIHRSTEKRLLIKYDRILKR